MPFGNRNPFPETGKVRSLFPFIRKEAVLHVTTTEATGNRGYGDLQRLDPVYLNQACNRRVYDC